MNKKGFTIVELVVVVGIVAFLSAIAYNSYHSSVVKSRWAEASPCLANAVLRLENFRSNHGSYPQSSDPWNEINADSDCSEHYMGNILVTNDGENYIVAFWDVKKKVIASSGNDIWAQTDVNGAQIHVNNTLDQLTTALPAGYSLPAAPSP